MLYKITETAEDIKDAKIEKAGVLVYFTMRDIEAHEENLKRTLMELVAKAGLEKAKMTNVENFHPFVKEMSLEDLSTAHTYMTAKMMFEVASGKAEEIEKQLKEYEAEKIEIVKQIPDLEPVPLVAPEEVKDEPKEEVKEEVSEEVKEEEIAK